MSEVFDFLYSLFDHSDDFVCLATLQTKPFYVNASGRLLLGMDTEVDVSDTRLHDYYTDETWTHLREAAIPEDRQARSDRGDNGPRHERRSRPLPGSRHG